MPTDLCPYCRKIRNMRTVVLLQQDPNQNERKKGIETRVYHCEACNSFVREERVRDPIGGRAEKIDTIVSMSGLPFLFQAQSS